MSEYESQKADYPYAPYEKALEKILDQATKDYWVQYIDVNRHQIAVSHTYLWVSVAFIGGYSSFVAVVMEKNLACTPCTVVFLFFAIVLSIIALGVCLYALPARGRYKKIGQSWGTFSQRAYQALENKSESLYQDSLTQLIDEFDAAAFHNLATNSKRASLLRTTSWLLIASYIFAILSSITFGAGNLQLSIKSEQVMAEEEKPNQTTQQPQKPVGQKPQGPISSQPSVASTHGEQSSKEIFIVTEGWEPPNSKE